MKQFFNVPFLVFKKCFPTLITVKAVSTVIYNGLLVELVLND